MTWRSTPTSTTLSQSPSPRMKDLSGGNLKRRLRKRRTYQILTFWIRSAVNQCRWCRRKQFRKTGMERSTGNTERRAVDTNQPLRSSESLRRGTTRLQRRRMASAARRSTSARKTRQRLRDNLRKVKRERTERDRDQRPGPRLL